ncbi:hypothetical protein PR001_g4365 [Phytophthora rubi]|nr:hypothetical protein PR002_g6052 [Phytophthora rubi]KAE9047019.1 hypothetical protein PR001_g4365 [Phytophthora rubi]
MEVVIPIQLLPSRWRLTSMQSDVPVDKLPGARFAVGHILRYKEKPWDSNRKFKEAQHVATTISEMMSEMGMPQYRAALSALQEVARRFERGECEGLFDQIAPMVADPPDSPVFLSVDDEDVDIDGAGARADQSESASEE